MAEIKNMDKDIEIRNATLEDIDEISSIERMCFPEAEAATRESFLNRLSVYPNHFWVLTVEDKIISVINGLCTNEDILNDTMYEDANMHLETGDWQMIFGVVTRPEYQRQGYAEKLMWHVIEDIRRQGRKGLVLTCKDKLVHYYEKFGFVNYGVSESIHGGAVWYDMKLVFPRKIELTNGY